MKILAISDIEDKILESTIVNNPEKFKSLDYIFSCGDLPRKYIEYITDSIHKSLYFVIGNHFALQFYGDKINTPKMKKKLYSGIGMRHKYGGVDMHGRVEILKDYILVGFGGSMRYNPGNCQFEEHEMYKLVKKAIRRIKMIRLIDFLLFRRKKEIIVMSHAPVAGIHDKEDRCHNGFQSFRDFIIKMKPILWLHGHIHLEGQVKQQQSILEETLIVNVYSSRIIEINGKDIKVSQVYK